MGSCDSEEALSHLITRNFDGSGQKEASQILDESSSLKRRVSTSWAFLLAITLAMPTIVCLYFTQTVSHAVDELLLVQRNSSTKIGISPNDASQLHFYEDTMTKGVTDRLRLEIAVESIKMMQRDTEEAAKGSYFADIGRFADLVEQALDTIGVRGVHTDLFETQKFMVALVDGAKLLGLHRFPLEYTHTKPGDDHQPVLSYHAIPNDRKYFGGGKKELCFGCMFWLRHYVGAIAADKLLQDGSLLLESGSNDRIFDVASYIRELQRVAQMDFPDIIIESQHAFLWEYMQAKMPNLNRYPRKFTEHVCGESLDKKIYIDDLNNDLGKLCAHGIGHGVYYIMARRQLNHTMSARTPFNAEAGFILNEDLLCEAFKICYDAPEYTIMKNNCLNGIRHTYRTAGFGEGNENVTTIKFLHEQEARCMGRKMPASEKDWAELTKEEQAAAKVLGYDEETWDDESPITLGLEDNDERKGDPSVLPATEKDWAELTKEEQVAAEFLGYKEEIWDEDED